MKNFLIRLSFSFIVMGMMACQRVQMEPIATATSIIATEPALSATGQPATAALESVLLTQTATAIADSPTPVPQPAASLPTPTLPANPTPFAPEMTEELMFNLLNQQGGAISSVAVVSQIAFIGVGPRLQSIDISDPANPQAIGYSSLLPGLIGNVIIHNQTAYVTANQYLLWLDIHDPLNMIVQGQIELPGPGIILLRDNVIYAAGRISVNHTTHNEPQSYIATLDISTSPRLLDVIELDKSVIALALAGDSLYVGQRGNPALLRIDVMNPVQIGETSHQIGGVLDVFSLRVYGHTLFVGSSNGVVALDVTDPQRPSQLWHEDGPHIAQVSDLAVFENRIFTWGQQAAGTYIPSQAAITLPESLSAPDYLFSSRVIAAEDYLYIADGSLTIYSITGIEPTVESQYVSQTGGTLAVSDDILYVGNVYNGLVAYGLPGVVQMGTFSPVPAGEPTSGNIYTIEASGNQLYLTGDEELRIVNASDLTLSGRVQSAENISLLFQQAGRRVATPVVANVIYLYALVDEQEKIMPYNVSDPTHPLPLDVIPLDRDMRVAAMAATQQWLIVSLYTITDSTGRGQLLLYEVSGDKPALAANVDVAEAPSVLKIHNDFLLAGGSISAAVEDQLELYSLPDLNRIGQIPVPAIHDIEIVRNLALVTMRQEKRLEGFDISNTAAPRNVGTFQLAAEAAHLAVFDNYLVVTNEDMGIFVFEVNQ